MPARLATFRMVSPENPSFATVALAALKMRSRLIPYIVRSTAYFVHYLKPDKTGCWIFRRLIWIYHKLPHRLPLTDRALAWRLRAHRPFAPESRSSELAL